MDAHFSFLALGDSYTIGEAVDENKRWPIQLKALLNAKGIVLNEVDIIAKTGWTTDELLAAINDKSISRTYNFVSLLIGVNNQYRGYPIDNYEKEFAALLDMAIGFAAGDAKNVIVLSIPDWGAMPFADGKDRNEITKHIDDFNAVNKRISLAAGVIILILPLYQD
ncbi:MAG: GDSL-type esterase/lipase family protein [Sphingobacteriales bacterium JAD_PAG50586_3]|nr:MAG: GDSL-type esterase/lipase family protein [Sphingobacteriales bacterium JAD_PAG50586_3]